MFSLSQVFKKPKLKPLYVRRDVLNAPDIIEWAKSVGFDKCVPPDEMHVTIVFSKKPIDRTLLSPKTNTLRIIPEGDRRKITPLGDEGAVVLKFQSPALQQRWQDFLKVGASWDYEGYQPHLTLTYHNPPDIDLKKIKPYDGIIILGPELYQSLDEDWADKLVEKQQGFGSIFKFDTNEPRDQHGRWIKDSTVYYHGSVSGDLRGGNTGLHLGTRLAAKQALEARIGVPAEGEWDGTREYGKTLLAGKIKLQDIEKKEGRYVITGMNCSAPDEDYYPLGGILCYPDGNAVPLSVKPSIKPYRLATEMSNTRRTPHPDFKANGYMAAQKKKGTARRGYYYTNEGEDSGSISVTVPNGTHIVPVDGMVEKKAKPPKFNPLTNQKDNFLLESATDERTDAQVDGYKDIFKSHDVSSEPRDEKGKWTTHGIKGLPEDADLSHPSLESVRTAVGRGVFNLTATKEEYGYSSGATTYALNILPKEIPADWKQTKRGKYYDPKYMAETEYGGTTAINQDPSTGEPWNQPEGKEEGYIFRGMSYEEYQHLRETGQIATLGDYNLGDEQAGLTYYSTDKGQAAHYASGFAPWQYQATISSPAVMIKIKDPGNHVNVAGTGETEVGIRGPLKSSDIEGVYFGHPISIDPGYLELIPKEYGSKTYTEGSRSSMGVSLRWDQNDVVKKFNAYHGDDGKFASHSVVPLKRDLPRQAEWLNHKAVGLGYSSADELSKLNPEVFMGLAQEWRKDHTLEPEQKPGTVKVYPSGRYHDAKQKEHWLDHKARQHDYLSGRDMQENDPHLYHKLYSQYPHLQLIAQAQKRDVTGEARDEHGQWVDMEDGHPHILKHMPFSFSKLSEHRFLYDPKTHELVLGSANLPAGSHAQDLAAVGVPASRYDAFVKGYVTGSTKDYPDGIIHFLPPVVYEWDEKKFEGAADAIELFIKNGAMKKTQLVGFGATREQTVEEAMPSVVAKRDVSGEARDNHGQWVKGSSGDVIKGLTARFPNISIKVVPAVDGVKGEGGRYFPDQRLVQVTPLASANTIAHEFGHAVIGDLYAQKGRAFAKQLGDAVRAVVGGKLSDPVDPWARLPARVVNAAKNVIWGYHTDIWNEFLAEAFARSYSGKTDRLTAAVAGVLTSLEQGSKTQKAAVEMVGDTHLMPFVSFKDKMRDHTMNQMQLIASLHTSRLSNYGFTAEAKALGMTEYAISEQLDTRICPICKIMHGKRFKVADANNLLKDVFSVQSQGDMRTIQPWPKQDKRSVAALGEMSNEELVAHHWNMPPFHPRCRGILVHVNKVPRIEDTPSFLAAMGKEQPLENIITQPPDTQSNTLGTDIERAAILSAYATIKTRYLTNPVEHGMGLDSEGNTVLEKSGTANHIDLNAKEMEYLEQGTFIHNHPNNFSLSMTDLTLAAERHLQQIIAIGTDGSEFVAFDVVSASTHKATEQYMLALEAGANLVLSKYLFPETFAGTITEKEANIFYTHMINVMLDDYNVMVYRAKLGSETGPAIAKVTALMESKVGMKNLENEMVSEVKKLTRGKDYGDLPFA